MDYFEKEIAQDGNCFFRAISYYYREDEDEHLEFRNLLYEWLKAHKEDFI